MRHRILWGSGVCALAHFTKSILTGSFVFASLVATFHTSQLLASRKAEDTHAYFRRIQSEQYDFMALSDEFRLSESIVIGDSRAFGWSVSTNLTTSTSLLSGVAKQQVSSYFTWIGCSPTGGCNYRICKKFSSLHPCRPMEEGLVEVRNVYGELMTSLLSSVKCIKLITYRYRHYAVYSQLESGINQTSVSVRVCEVLYDSLASKLYLREISSMAMPTSASRYGHACDWSFFFYEEWRKGSFSSASANGTAGPESSHLHIINSLYPHRILGLHLLAGESNAKRRSVNVTMLYNTELRHEKYAEYFLLQYWPYGKIVSSTLTSPALIDTPWGSKYISFFLSRRCIFHSKHATTFIGAYLFDAKPPFGITHFAKDPLFPRLMYDALLNTTAAYSDDLPESLNGFVDDGGKLYISVTNMRKETVMMVLNKAPFLTTLISAQSDVVSEYDIYAAENRRITPEYTTLSYYLRDLASRQRKEFLLGFWRLPNVHRNPAMAVLPCVSREEFQRMLRYQPSSSSNNTSFMNCADEAGKAAGKIVEPVIVQACTPDDYRMSPRFQCEYYFMGIGTHAHTSASYKQQYDEPWQHSGKIRFLYDFVRAGQHTGGRRRMRADDMRLVSIPAPNEMVGVFNSLRPFAAGKGKGKSRYPEYRSEMFIVELKYDSKVQELVPQKAPKMLDIKHEVGGRPQKNWTPFVYRADKQWPQSHSLLPPLLFVYSVFPHRIVGYSNQSSSRPSAVIRMSTIALTNITSYRETKTTISDMEDIWQYGEPRGGSQAEIVDTPFGGRKLFLTFFHSCKERGIKIKTYYWGAYLFDTEPPFGITHFSREPISAEVFYDPSVSWVHRTLDFSVFPMGFVARNGIIYVSLGSNDKRGFMVSLNQTAFLQSLRPVSSG